MFRHCYLLPSTKVLCNITAVVLLPLDLLTGALMAAGQLEAGLQEKVREALLKRHHHQSEKRLSSIIPLVRSIADVGKKHCDHPRHGERASQQEFVSHLCCGGQGVIFEPQCWFCFSYRRSGSSE